jgi:hypothetical protein
MTRLLTSFHLVAAAALGAVTLTTADASAQTYVVQRTYATPVYTTYAPATYVAVAPGGFYDRPVCAPRHWYPRRPICGTPVPYRSKRVHFSFGYSNHDNVRYYGKRGFRRGCAPRRNVVWHGGHHHGRRHGHHGRRSHHRRYRY